MILCDSDVMINFMKGREETLNEMRKIGYENVQISAVTVMELYQGAINKADLASIKRKISYFDVLPIVAETSEKAVELIDKFSLSHGLKIADSLIGSTSIVQEMELFTYNLKDFRFIPGIKLYQSGQ